MITGTQYILLRSCKGIQSRILARQVALELFVLQVRRDQSTLELRIESTLTCVLQFGHSTMSGFLDIASHGPI